MNFQKAFSLMSLLIASLVVTAGCSQPTNTVEKYDASPFLLSSEPDGAIEVIAAKETAKDQDEIVVVGRIGGSLDPWVKGAAAFSIVDNSLIACSDETEDGETCSCTTPWDYCCELDKLSTSTVLVKFVDDDGRVIPHDAKGSFGVVELDTVIVKGTVKRNEAGGFSILASEMFVRK